MDPCCKTTSCQNIAGGGDGSGIDGTSGGGTANAVQESGSSTSTVIVAVVVSILVLGVAGLFLVCYKRRKRQGILFDSLIP